MKRLRIRILLSAGLLVILLLAALMFITNTLQKRQKEITSGDFRTSGELISRFGSPTKISESYDDGVRMENWRYSRQIPIFGYDVAYTIYDDRVVAFIK